MTEGKEQIEIPPPAMIKPMRLWTGMLRLFLNVRILMICIGKQLTGLIIKHSSLSNVIINLETEGRNYVKVGW